ncbi:hypothetical protein E2C01_099721 [Portunus trituberculatus]|uniref:Uncharacterized protein n=1 Tax=Portunus trituberculatus TaxID=210409 RepID=A0A5B7K114_PORTR|nr:hypothetical protein [Portunus trituberculatus]
MEVPLRGGGGPMGGGGPWYGAGMGAPPCTGQGSPSQVARARAGTERALFTVPGGPGVPRGP